MTERAQTPIIDCHHHVWAPTAETHPWLAPGANIPFRYGDYSAIKRDYRPEDYDRDASGFDVVGHVTMEGEWDPVDPVGETRWIAEVFARRPDYRAHVARAFLDRGDIGDQLAGHAEFLFVRGIRHKPTSAPSAAAIEIGAPGSLSDPNWQRGYRRLADHGLHFELQAPWWHIDELLELRAAVPETPVVINHMFMPGDRDPATLRGWREAITRAATDTGLTIKISGMGLPSQLWRLDDHRALIDHVLERFGPDRCMVASNFPVDRLTGSFATIIGGYQDALSDLTPAERAAVFHDTAARVYRLNTPLVAEGA
ncbi:MAG: amidohydrolase family protein [Pseudomonadota bacterium]